MYDGHMMTQRERAALDRWITTEPEPLDDDEHAPDCDCAECENERALDEDAAAYFDRNDDD